MEAYLTMDHMYMHVNIYCNGTMYIRLCIIYFIFLVIYILVLYCTQYIPLRIAHAFME